MMVIGHAGHHFEASVAGRGEPTVVLETGLGAESSEWAAVERDLLARFRVFRYDRLGRGDSDPASGPRGAGAIVDDLRGVLDAVGVPAPFLLVGHSFGGLLMRVFAHRYASDVRGLVLAESMHPRQFDALGPAFPAPSPGDPPALVGMRSFWTAGWRAPSSTPERIDFERAFADARAAESLGDLPLTVITAGAAFRGAPFLTPRDGERLQALWDGLQSELVRLSTRGRHVVVRGSGHFLQRDAPGAVAGEILGLGARTD